MFIEIKEKPMDTTSGIPLINEIIIPYGSGIYAQRRFNVRLMVEWLQKTPEAMGIINAIANDVVTHISFRPATTKDVGRPTKEDGRVDKADQFSSSNRYKQQIKAAVIDMLMTGDFYFWLGLIKEQTLKDSLLKVSKESDLFTEKELNFIQSKEFKAKKYMDDDFSELQQIKYVPSETVQIDYTDEKVIGYIQTVYSTFKENTTQLNANYISTGFQRRYWYPEQIIHGKFIEMSGKVYGFTPLYADSAVIRTLGLIKDYAGTFFENGGVPDWLFMFESQGFTNKQNIEELKESLQKYKMSPNKHGNLVGETSGKFNAIKLNDFQKEMEFRQLMVMYAGLVAFSMGFPSARLKAIIGADVKSSTGETDAETDAYQRNIEQLQDYVCDLMNTQLWTPFFKVKSAFSKGYKQDEIREVQRDTMKSAYLNSLKNVGIELSDEFVKEYLDLDDKDVVKIDMKKEEPVLGMAPNNKVLPGGSGNNKNKQLSDNKLIKGPASQAYQEEKKKTAPKDINKQTGS